MASFLFTVSLLVAVIYSSSVAGENATAILWRLCSDTQATDAQSFDVNFVDAMEIISKSIANSGFGLAVVGENSSDRVYALGQCLNYLTNIDCRLCYAESRVKIPLCLPSTEARVLLNGCFLRYGSHNFSQESVSDSDSVVCDSSKNVTDEDKLREIASGLVRNLTSKAYEERDYYKEESALVSTGVTVYGVAQCWRSLNKSGCRSCLDSAKNRVFNCLPGSEGKAYSVGCFVRYSLEPFYVNDDDLEKSNGSVSVGRILGVTLGSCLAAVVVIGGAVLWRRRRRRGSYNNDNLQSEHGSMELLNSISKSHLSFPYEDLRKATEEFNLKNKIGQGGYGTVYKGILADGREIAVKRLFLNTTQWLDQFFNEVNLISQVQHKNLVKLLGCSIDGPESLLVYEFLYNTSLDRFLFDPFRKNVLHWERRFDILVGTAEGIAYLHEASVVRIIHRDIKASNILLDEKFKPKLADFGLARYFAEGQSHLSTGVAGTLGYMAPEYVVHGQLTEKADVYSYGIFVMEMITGRKNNSLSLSNDSHSLMQEVWENFNSNTLIQLVDSDLQGRYVEEDVVRVFHVGLLCAQSSPSLRPPMWKVVEMLLSRTRHLPAPTQPPFIRIKGVDSGTGSSSSQGFSRFIPSSNKSQVSLNQLSVSIMQAR